MSSHWCKTRSILIGAKNKIPVIIGKHIEGEGDKLTYKSLGGGIPVMRSNLEREMGVGGQQPIRGKNF